MYGNRALRRHGAMQAYMVTERHSIIEILKGEAHGDGDLVTNA